MELSGSIQVEKGVEDCGELNVNIYGRHGNVLAGYVTDQRRAVQLFTAEVLRIKEAPHGTAE